MTLRHRSRPFSWLRTGATLALGALTLCLVAACGPDYAPEELDRATDRVRSLYFQRDYGAGGRLGESWAQRAPDAMELRAWHLLNVARHPLAPRVEEAVAEAEALVSRAPESPWSHFALAATLNRQDERGPEALSASAEALELATEDERSDALWLRAETLREKEGEEAAVAFVDSLPEAERTADLLVRQAVALHFLANEREEDDPDAADELDERAFRLFAEAREMNSEHLEAHFLPGSYRMTARDLDRALPLLARAAELSPAVDVHRNYWRAIRSRTDLEPDEKRERILADASSLLERRPDAPDALHAVWSIYGELDLEDRREPLASRLLSEFSNTAAAEWVLVSRYRDMRREIYEAEQAGEEPDSALEADYRQSLVSFIERPEHARESLLGDACRNLFQILQQMEEPDVTDERLREIVRCMAEHEGINHHVAFGQGAIELAEHTDYHEEAAELAREGREKARERIESQRESGLYETEGDFQRSLDAYTGRLVDALGWVHFQAGRLEEAKQELLRAHDMDPENRLNLYHLGRYYESRDSLQQAEDYYIDGAMVQSMGENPNEEALRALYERRNGSAEGWESYRANLEQIDAERRKEEVLASRIEDPDSMVDFTMATLAGGTYSSERLEGRIAVINFWGLWCGPCVAEMPDVHEFHQAVRDDPNVEFLTINNDTDPDEVRDWMEERGYDFPVLLDEGYLDEVDLTVFPTTWFVAPDGSIAFSKEGWSEELVQEFTWRTEALRSSTE